MPLFVPPTGLLVSDQTLGATSNDIQFLSIPQGYKHLQLIAQTRGDNASTLIQLQLQFNADTTNGNYVGELMQGKTSAVAAAALGGFYIGSTSAATATANHAGMVNIMIPNYAGTTFFKSAYSNCQYYDGTDRYSEGIAFYWTNTAAITRIDMKPNNGNFIAGSRFTLYALN